MYIYIQVCLWLNVVAGSKAQQSTDCTTKTGVADAIASVDAVTLHRKTEDDILGIIFVGMSNSMFYACFCFEYIIIEIYYRSNCYSSNAMYYRIC